MDVGKLFVSLGLNVEEFERNLNTASKKMEDFGKRMNKVGKDLSMKVTAPLTALGGAAVYAFTIQEGAENRLRAALVANGREVDSLYNQYKEFATEMQRLTVVGDESTLKMIQQAESMGITGDAAMRAAKNAIALAAAQGMSAESAIRYTAALEQGDATMLKRYLPTLRSVEDESQMAAKAQELLANMFQVAEAEAKTAGGQMTQMKNAVGDLMEQFGAIIAEAILPFINRIKELAERFQGLDDRQKRLIVTFGAIAAAIGPVLIVVGQMSLGMSAILGLIPKIIAGFRLLSVAMASTPWGAVAAIVGVLAAAALPKLITMLTGADGKFQDVTKSVGKLETATESLKEAQDDLLSVMSDPDGVTDDQIKLSKEQARQHIINADAAIQEAQALRQLLIERRKDVLVAMQRSKIGGGAQVGEIQAIEAEIKRLEESMAEAELTSFRMAAILDSLGDTAPEVAKVVPQFVSIGNEAERAEIKIDRLRNSFEKLELQMQLAKAAQEALDEMSRQLGATQDRHAAIVENLGSRLAATTSLMQQSTQATNTMSQQQAAAMFQLADNWEQAAIQIVDISKAYLVDALTSTFAQMGANLASGVSIISNVKNIVIGTLADLAIQVGRIAIGVGFAVEGIKTALKSLNPAIAIVAGAALIALGGAAKAALARSAEKAGGVPAFADGGIVSGPTLGLMGEYAGARSNPEVIAPLNKLQSMMGGVGGEVTFRIEGRELVGILSREGSLAKRV